MKYYKIFFSIFVLLLLVTPLSYINNGSVSDQENRTLAKFPEVKKKGKLNGTYGKDFESWLGDRFGGRNYLVSFSESFKYILGGHHQKRGVIKGKEGWLFGVYLKNSINLSKEAIHSLNKLKKICDENNIRLFVILPSQSVDIYSEYYPLEYDNRLDETTTDFLNKTDISIIISEENLKKKKKREKVFFKKDSHWTDAGALVTYKDFVRALKNIYPNFPEYNVTDFEISFVAQEKYKREGVSINGRCKKLGINNSALCPTEQYPYYKYKGKIKKTQIKNIQKKGAYKYFNEKGFPLKVILVSRSFGSSFDVFLTSYVRDVITINTNKYGFPDDAEPSIKPYIQYIKEEKPNVLIILIQADSLQAFL